MAARRRRMVVLWLGLATILVAARGSPLQRNRRILNEPGDIPNKGNTTLPYGKRQQIIYLLNKENQSSKRDKEPGKTVAMEKYAKELSSDGRVVIPNASRLLVSEDFHSGKYKEMAVNKGDGPPNAISSGKTDRQDSTQKQQQQQQQPPQQQQQQKLVNTAVKKSDSVQVVTESRPEKLVNISTSYPQENFKRTKSYEVESNDQKHMPLTRNSDTKILNEESPSLRKKDSFIKPVGRLFDGEILPPAKPIEPDVFEIGQNDVADSHRSHFRGEFGPHSGIHRARYLEDRPIRRWRPHRHAYYHHRPAPVLMGHQPSMYYMPLYAGRPNVQMAQFAPSQDVHAAPLSDPGEGSEYGRQPVMMQPLVPMVSSAAAQPGYPLVPSQPMLQSPFVQQPEDRSNLYTVPMATAPQQPPQQPPQQFIYPMMAVPAMQQPQPQLQLVQQPAFEQGARLDHLASHWTDEPGHERSEVNEESDHEHRPREYDDEKSYDDPGRDSRYDEERYHGYNEDERMDDERRYQDYRNSLREEEEREYERERLYRERGYYQNSEPRYDQDTRYVDNVDENGSVRSPPPLPAPTAAEESNEDDNEEENESEENERALQDSRDDPPPAEEGPPEVERGDHQREMQSREQPSVIRIPSFQPPSPPMNSRFAYPGQFSTSTYSREQLLGPSVPLRERVLPRFMHAPPRMAPIESPSGDISEMSASEARFRERMRLELAEKDTIPRGFHSDLNGDGFKNVVIRLNGEPLENASELRSKIIDGRIVQGKGKTIKSKGPMRIRVTHKGKGKNRIKFIDIISPKKYSVTESRSKIGRAPTMNGSKHNLKKSQIHKKNSHGRFPSHLRVKNVTAATNMSSNTKVPGN